MKPYPSYKDSGIEWIGDIPEHWEVKKLKWLIDEPLKYGANESAISDDPNNPRYIRITDFGDDGKLRQNTFRSLPYSVAKNYLLEEGDLLFARSGATVGKTFQFKEYNGLACYAGYLIKAKPDENKLLSDYLYCYTKSSIYENWKNSVFIQATIQNIGADKYKELPIILPTNVKEQTAIADFLDHKTAQIDQSIEKGEELIRLLKEYRAALIHEAVTRGLDDSAPMKDNNLVINQPGVEKIPADWNLYKISRVFKIIGSGTTPKSSDFRYYNNGDINWINTGDLNDGYLYATNRKITSIAMKDYSTLKLYPINSLVIAMYGATIGKVSVTKIKSTTNQACCVLSNSLKIKIKFAFYWFINNKQHIVSLSLGGGQPNISQEIIRNLYIPVPPIEEQRQIIEYIETETARIDAEIGAAEREIRLLKEYRQALISEAVTGKIDVREVSLE